MDTVITAVLDTPALDPASGVLFQGACTRFYPLFTREVLVGTEGWPVPSPTAGFDNPRPTAVGAICPLYLSTLRVPESYPGGTHCEQLSGPLFAGSCRCSIIEQKWLLEQPRTLTGTQTCERVQNGVQKGCKQGSTKGWGWAGRRGPRRALATPWWHLPVHPLGTNPHPGRWVVYPLVYTPPHHCTPPVYTTCHTPCTLSALTAWCTGCYTPWCTWCYTPWCTWCNWLCTLV